MSKTELDEAPKLLDEISKTDGFALRRYVNVISNSNNSNMDLIFYMRFPIAGKFRIAYWL